MKTYIIFDSRASYDVDAACVLDCLGEVSEKQAKKALNKDWKNQGAVLVSYDSEGVNLTNQTVVHIGQ